MYLLSVSSKFHTVGYVFRCGHVDNVSLAVNTDSVHVS